MNKEKTYEIIKTEIGNIAIFWLTVRNLIDIEKELGQDLENINSNTYIKILIKYICHKEENITDNNKPNIITITEAEIDNLNSDDIENIAIVYVNKFLNDFSLYNKLDNKKDNELYVDYIYRLHVELNKVLKINLENIFGNINIFSKSIQNGIKNNTIVENDIKTTLNKLYNLQNDNSIDLNFCKLNNNVDLNQTNNNKQKTIIGLIENISEYTSQTFKTQTQIAIDSKQASNRNLMISYTVVIISLFSIIFSIYTNIQNSKNNEKYINSIINNLNIINTNIEKTNNFKLQNKINNITTQIDSLKTENSYLINKHNKNINKTQTQ